MAYSHDANLVNAKRQTEKKERRHTLVSTVKIYREHHAHEEEREEEEEVERTGLKGRNNKQCI